MALFVCMLTMAQAQGIVPAENANGIAEFLKMNWQPLLLAVIGLLEVVVRLTPTKKDNSILNIIIKILEAILPNKDKQGGTHSVKK